MACAYCKREDEKRLKKVNPKDSKKLSPKQREETYQQLKKFCTFKWIEISADDLNRLMNDMSLNDIEAKVMAELISDLKEGDVMIDMPDRYSWTFRERMAKFGVTKFEAEHKADDRYPIVAAASICAKIMRDKKIEEIRKATCDFGSGYPSDSKTTDALHDKALFKILIPFIRKKWKTIDDLAQTKLSFGDESDQSEDNE